MSDRPPPVRRPPSWRTAPRETVRGLGTALFTVCLAGRVKAFTEGALVAKFVRHLEEALWRHYCRADAYCFMPDHLHVLITGVSENADAWQAMVKFKQVTGAWFWRNRPSVRWQSGFDVRFLNHGESVEAAARYVHNNPVRAGLVESWDEYRYSGVIPWHDWPGLRRGPSRTT